MLFYAHSFIEAGDGQASCQWVEEKEARQFFPDLLAARAACDRLGEGHAVVSLLRAEQQATMPRGQRTVTTPPARPGHSSVRHPPGIGTTRRIKSRHPCRKPQSVR